MTDWNEKLALLKPKKELLFQLFAIEVKVEGQPAEKKQEEEKDDELV
eukprot:CAMPEP_0202959174 /NCGR_PEP_ID=MMETSP1396-20130829/3440_1 /ASSEMBLY_ACC=CAM_ASM_000872 /TAXON_ID= /ORGANISM="Pseudokeronopsis sp., Strain Brazil" /LENGTH=46 /DNA_ID= /DNA_START= /DNA_END= /DNA_ORIENTATION=